MTGRRGLGWPGQEQGRVSPAEEPHKGGLQGQRGLGLLEKPKRGGWRAESGVGVGKGACERAGEPSPSI